MGKAIIHIDPLLLYDTVRRGLLLPEEFSVVKVLSPIDMYNNEPYHEDILLLIEGACIQPTNVELLSKLPTLTPLYQVSFDEEGNEQVTLVKLTCRTQNSEVILFPTS